MSVHATVGERLLVSTSFVLLLLFSACTTSERDVAAVPEPTAAAALTGQDLYIEYCASCHGSEAHGDGPVAEVLKKKPADLTSIAARHGGEYPEEYVRKVIDGREEFISHGTRTMPIWGNIWTDTTRASLTDEQTDKLLDRLVAYLESIQREQSSADVPS